MKKISAIMLIFAVMTVGLVQASENPAQTVEEAAEQAFVARLNEEQRILFSKMTPKQKAEAMTAATTPNEAVDQVLEQSIEAQR